MNRTFRLLLLICLLSPLATFAVELSKLYVAKVDAELSTKQGLSVGFDQVMIRASGQRSVLQHPVIQEHKKRLRDYIVQYGHIEEEGRRWLEVTFNQEAIERLLRLANQPIWGSLRPLTLVWLVQEQNFSRELVGESSPLLQQARVAQMTQERGVPVILPLLDLDDMMQVEAADVWGHFLEPVQQASLRYNPDQIVLAKLYQPTENQYELQWRIYPFSDGGESAVLTPWYQGQISGESPELLAQWWQQMSDVLGQRFATQTAGMEAETIDIAIHNLTDLPRVLAAEKSLSAMAMVSTASLQQLDASRALFSIQLLGTADDFFNALKLDKRLQPLELEPKKFESLDLESQELESQEIEPTTESQTLPTIPAYMWVH